MSLVSSPWRGAVAAAVALVVLVAGASEARASFLTGLADLQLANQDASTRTFWQDQNVAASSGIVRINIYWRGATAGKPASPSDPLDPAYSFDQVDRAVIDSVSRGNRVLLTVYGAPEFAEGPNESSEAREGTWKPDPKALGLFAEAVGSRYSGGTTVNGLGVLPRVGYFEAWNEPNLSEYVSPQYTKKSTFAGDHYRAMVNAFSKGIKNSENQTAKVVAGATAPYGDPTGGTRTRPLRFMRDFLCLKKDLSPRNCADEARFDILSHHPITLSGGPDRSAIHPDDVAMPDVKHLIKTLRTAEKRGTVRGGNHPVWATEFWWETDPPDPFQGVPLATQARWIEESFYSLWKQGVDVGIWFLLVDEDAGSDGISGQQSGLFFRDRSKKPAFTAFRFPFVGDRISKKKVNVWTIPPTTGTLEIQEERGGVFVTIDRMDVTDAKPDQKKIKASGKTKLRALLNGETSLPYTVK